MNITGIIVEYNPLHNGHLYHIEKSKEVTSSNGIIAVMSGSFVQRGTPALVDKWTRAKMALLNGVDLVIELPVLYSLSSAEFFAFGGVTLLDSLGVVNNLCFGSESGDISPLFNIAKVLLEEPTVFKENLKENLDNGVTFPVARANALHSYFVKEGKHCLQFNNLLDTANNILAVEYCKNLLKINSNITPYTIKREGGTYNSMDLQHKFSSATAIRNYIKNAGNLKELKNYMPKSILNILMELKDLNYSFPFEEEMLPFIKHKYFSGENGLENLPDVSEGLHNRIYRALNESTSLDDTMLDIKTKRYTYTRISRILCQYFIGFDAIDTYSLRKEPCPYARILGFNKKGSEILKTMKKKSSIPLYTKMPKEISPTLHLDIKATKCYSLINRYCNPLSDFKNMPIILD